MGNILGVKQMNIENAKTLIKRLEKCEWVDTSYELREVHNETSFNMANSFFECGSPSCVAGHCKHLMTGSTKGADAGSIAEYLEIDKDTASDIYDGDGGILYKDLNEITVEEVIERLKDLIKENP